MRGGAGGRADERSARPGAGGRRGERSAHARRVRRAVGAKGRRRRALYALLCTKVVDAPGVFCSNSSAFFTYLIRVAGWGEPEAAATRVRGGLGCGGCGGSARRDVLVVAHVHGHALRLGVRLHLLQLRHARRARLLEEDVRDAVIDQLRSRQRRLQRRDLRRCHMRRGARPLEADGAARTSLSSRGLSAVRPEISASVGPCGSERAVLRLQREVCGAAGCVAGTGEPAHRELELLNALGELGTVLGGHLLRPRVEGLAGRGVGARAEEVRLDDGGKLRRRAHALEHLLAVVPAHATLGHTAADLPVTQRSVRHTRWSTWCQSTSTPGPHRREHRRREAAAQRPRRWATNRRCGSSTAASAAAPTAHGWPG